VQLIVPRTNEYSVRKEQASKALKDFAGDVFHLAITSEQQARIVTNKTMSKLKITLPNQSVEHTITPCNGFVDTSEIAVMFKTILEQIHTIRLDIEEIKTHIN
jgi:hypothetical protein